MAVVVFEGERYVIDDFIPIDADSGEAGAWLREALPGMQGPSLGRETPVLKEPSEMTGRRQ